MSFTHSHTGFALVPLLVGVAIFGVLLSLTLAQLSFLDQLLVRTELQVLYATICYAQQVAQTRGSPCTIRCDADTHQYHCDNRTRTLPRSVTFGVKSGLYGSPGRNSVQVTKPITFDNDCIRATAHGSINAGTVYLVDTGNRYQYALSSAVSQVSYIRCYRYDTQWVMLK
jgi:Tfp pilus assembly protein FimT